MKQLYVAICLLVSSSCVMSMLPKGLSKNLYKMLVQKRDKSMYHNVCSKLDSQVIYSGQFVHDLITQSMSAVAASDDAMFDECADQFPLAMTDSSRGSSGRQKLVLGNNYDFGGVACVTSLILGFGLGYLVFSNTSGTGASLINFGTTISH